MTYRRLGLGATVTLLVALGALDLVQHYHTDPAAAFAFSAVRAVPLLFYRRMPLEAWLTGLAAAVALAVVSTPVMSGEPWPWAGTTTAALTALGGLVASRGHRRLSVTMLGVLTGLGLLLWIWPGRGDLTAVVVTSALCGAGILVGDVVRARRSIAVELAEERQVSAEERELRSVVEERARIARELHDVVAHHMSVIVVQSETARYRLTGLPDDAAAEFTEIARLARGSLSELRGLLSALRDDGADPNRTPQPTLGELPALVARIEAAGTPVTLTVAPGTGDLPQVLQLAVFRIVQEGLSNVVRHAPGARTWVDVTRTDQTLKVAVTNERAADGGPLTEKEGGHGLVGVRERVTLLGGRFEVDQPDGGWRLRAELPL
ncbi:MAG: histidine kinase [Actinophytocola sp.]|uniref:sensor histidine kinase n=1 Tax=Actinophytocola sp. TaxID=1872138 RepID=UPI003C746A4A